MKRKKDYVVLPFNMTQGCLNIEKVDKIDGLSESEKESTKDILINEINANYKKLKINSKTYCLIPIGIFLFIFGGILAKFIFPFNFILCFLGIIFLVYFFVYSLYVSYRLTKFYRNVSSRISKSSNEKLAFELILISVYTKRNAVVYLNNCSHFLIKLKTSKMTPERFKEHVMRRYQRFKQNKLIFNNLLKNTNPFLNPLNKQNKYLSQSTILKSQSCYQNTINLETNDSDDTKNIGNYEIKMESFRSLDEKNMEQNRAYTFPTINEKNQDSFEKVIDCYIFVMINKKRLKDLIL